MILCRDIRKAYGPKEVLRGFSATFEQGRVAVLVGPNGAGKTTLMRIIAGLQWPDDGLVQSRRAAYYSGFDSVPVRGTVDRLRRAVGLPPARERGAARLSRLSRGQLHIAGLEIVLDLDSDALLLDEPWTALDPDARENDRGHRSRRHLAVGRCIPPRDLRGVRRRRVAHDAAA